LNAVNEGAEVTVGGRMFPYPCCHQIEWTVANRENSIDSAVLSHILENMVRKCSN